MTQIIVGVIFCVLLFGVEYAWSRYADREFWTKGRTLDQIAWAERLRFKAIVLLVVGMACFWAASDLPHSSTLQLLALVPIFGALALIFHATNRVGLGRGLLALGLVVGAGALCVLAMSHGWLPGRQTFREIPPARMIIVALVAGALFLGAARLSRAPGDNQ